MKNFVNLTVISILLFLSGCASVPMASIDQDTKSKEFSPVANKASLYIYRNENFGAAILMSVTVNGATLGQTAAHSYFQLNLAPGKYNLKSYAENVFNLDLSLEAGKNYFVWQEVKMGMWQARSKLQQVDENTGKKGIMDSTLIASSISGDNLTPLDAVSSSPNSSILKKEKVFSTGTGFFVTNDGYMVTNFHVVAGASSITVFNSTEHKWLDATLIKSDPANDIAILKVDTKTIGIALASSFDGEKGNEILTEIVNLVVA